MLQKIHIGEEIRKELNTKKRSINWLAEEINCDQSNLNKQLKRQHLTTKMLYDISIALDRDFFALYSQFLYKKPSITNELMPK